jgi:hypothetical protein
MRLLRTIGLPLFCFLFASVALADTLPVSDPSFEALPNSPLTSSCGAGCSYQVISSFGGWTFTGAGGAISARNTRRQHYLL